MRASDGDVEYQPLSISDRGRIAGGPNSVTPVDQRITCSTNGKAFRPLEEEESGINNNDEINAWGFGNEERTNGIPVAAQLEPHNRIVINISGTRYETHESTLASLPDSLLGSTIRRAPYYRPASNDLYFERNREAFDSILFYYQSGGKDGGILVKPDGITDETFAVDVKFFELGEEAERMLGLVPEGNNDEFEGITSGLTSKIAALFEPNRTHNFIPLHRLIDVWTIAILVLFITLLCVQTLPSIKEMLIVNRCCNQSDTNVALETHRGISLFWSVGEKVCVSWFTLEYILRTLSTTHKRAYLLSKQGIFDMLSFLPYVIQIILKEIRSETDELYLHGVLNLLAFFSVFKLTRYSKGLRILMKVIQTSLKELVLLLQCVILSLILFSSVIYFFESSEQTTPFTSIPATFWFVTVTMTTVGYGDMTPTTVAGKIFSALCAVLGVCVVLAIPSTIIVSNFIILLFGAKNKAKKRQKRKKRSFLLERINRLRTVSLT